MQTTTKTYDRLIDEARSEARKYRETAARLIPKMYRALRDEERLSKFDARDRIEKDCIAFWEKRTIREFLPDECKDPKAIEAGRQSGRMKREIEDLFKRREDPIATRNLNSTSGSVLVSKPGRDEDEEGRTPEGKVLVDEDELADLRIRLVQMEREASTANVELEHARKQLKQTREVVDKLHEKVDAVDKENQKLKGKAIQTTLDKFMPTLKQIVHAAHKEKCPSRCGTWKAMRNIKIPK